MHSNGLPYDIHIILQSNYHGKQWCSISISENLYASTQRMSTIQSRQMWIINQNLSHSKYVSIVNDRTQIKVH